VDSEEKTRDHVITIRLGQQTHKHLYLRNGLLGIRSVLEQSYRVETVRRRKKKLGTGPSSGQKQ
jgi:hypothetical protein